MTGIIQLKFLFQKTLIRISENKKGIFWYFILPVLFFLFYFSIIRYYFYQSLADPIKARLEFTSYHLSNSFDQFIAERVNEVQNVSLNPSIQKILLGKEKKDGWHYLTRQKIKTNDISDEWLICDTLGNSVAANKSDSYGHAFPADYFYQNHFMEEWFRSGLAASHSNWVYVSEINQVDYNYKQQSWGIDFSTPIKSTQGKLLGVLKYRINWLKSIQIVSEEITKRNLDNNYSIFVFTKQGDLIFSNGKTQKLRIGKNSVLKTPNFEYAGHQYSSENYMYSWAASQGNRFLKGDSFFVLLTHPQITSSHLWGNLEFNLFIGIPLAILLVYQLSGWLWWRKNTYRQLTRLKNQIIKLNHNILSESQEVGSKEFRQIHSEVKKLSAKMKLQKEMEEKLLCNDFDFSGYESTLFLQSNILKIGKRLQQLHWESRRQQYISKGVQDINEILYGHQSRNTLSAFCSYIQRYTGLIALGCFRKIENTFEMTASWGITINKEIIEDYNIMFDCVQQQKILELKQVPASYVSLSSGLGSSNSINITLIPIIISNQSKGVMEVGSIKPLSNEVKSFILQAGSSLAAYWQYAERGQKNSYHLENNGF